MRAKIIIGLLITLVVMSMFATSSTRTNALPISRPMLSYTPEPNISIYMYELYGDGLRKDKKCAPGSTSFGCTAFCDNTEPEYKEWCQSGDPIEPYPYKSDSIVIPIQTYYLLDVLAGEMNPSPDWMPIPAALRAQAIAARSYVWWQYENVKLPIDNSNSFQVYVPYRFDKLNLNAAPMEPEILTPCHPYRFRNEAQELECNAIAARHYLATWNRDVPAFTQFSADVIGKTNTSPDGYPYLVGVEDPISSLACDAHYDGHGVGMSQWGAARWARGDQCALKGNGYEPWSVQWLTATQILFHYYTSVHLRDADKDNAILSPDWRWNPLLINWGTTDNQPPKMNAGSTSSYAVLLQNTGIYPWTCIKGQSKPIPPPSYRLRYRWLSGRSIIATGYGTPVCDLSPGDSTKVDLGISVPTVPPGTYTLRLDMYEDSAGFWFGDGGWPPYDVNVPIVTPPSPTPTPTSCGNDC